MKKLIAALFSVFTLFAVLPALTVTAHAENRAQGWDGNSYASMVDDNYGVFDGNSSELTALNEAVRGCAEELEMNVYIMIAGPAFYDFCRSESRSKEFADTAYESIFGKDTDGIFLLLDFTGNKPSNDYISTSGKAILFYQERLDQIISNLVKGLPPSGLDDYTVYHEDVASSVRAFLKDLQKYGGSTKGHGYYRDSNTGNYIYFRNGKLVITRHKPLSLVLKILFFAVLIGAIVDIIIYFVSKMGYKFKPTTNSTTYLTHDMTKFNTRGDQFLRTKTTRTYIADTSSSGRSGGGSRSSGGGHSGGSHGGGGFHR